MEDAMAARTTRKDARARLMKTMVEALDRIIPADESKPLKGSRFIDWEKQVTQFKQAVIPTLLEERAALEANAQVPNGGHCPHCGSDAVYLEKQTTVVEVRGPDGPVVIAKQHCRCRACGGSFSPSEP
jgi:DNA-directed RNA polymerase subunit RPC12/RpoP